jgi:hypothetical protein
VGKLLRGGFGLALDLFEHAGTIPGGTGLGKAIATF